MRTPAGAVMVDETGRANGRGAYVCRDEACIATAIRRDALARALAAAIPADLAGQLQRQLSPATGRSNPNLTFAGGTIGQE